MKWYAFRQYGDQFEIDIIGDIGHGGYSIQDFKTELDAVPASAPLTINISSDGGDPFIAFAIVEETKRRQGKTTARVRGIAASAASLIACGCSRLLIGADSFLMLHNPMAMINEPLDETALRDQARHLGSIREGMRNLYVRKSGLPVDRVQEIMNAGDYLDASQCLSLGLADEIIDEMAVAAHADLHRTPSHIKARMAKATTLNPHAIWARRHAMATAKKKAVPVIAVKAFDDAFAQAIWAQRRVAEQ